MSFILQKTIFFIIDELLMTFVFCYAIILLANKVRIGSMVFSSLTFIFIFLPFFLFIYFIVPFKLKNIILLIFSLLFYAWGEPKYVLLMIFVSILNYVGGYMIDKKQHNNIAKKIILFINIISNIAILFYFKYTNFLIDNMNYLGFDIDNLDIGLPLGISFFTFQTMSYTIDVYYRRIERDNNFLNFMVYVCMFPQLIAGPIVRYKDINCELKDRKINFEGFIIGMFYFLTGLFKKVIIANNVGKLFLMISNNINNASLLTAWLGVLAYSLQIYFDFSGYSTMAIGLGKMLGFNYPENFNYPYMARSITDFWRRWHITLSVWFRDYVYIPLGGNRNGKFKQIRNILIVWLLTGIWHGASWNYILWGLYYAIILIVEKFIIGKKIEKMPIFLQHLYATILIIVGWTIFACEDLSLLTLFLKKMFCNKVIIDHTFIFYLKNYFLFILSGIIFSTPIVKIINKKNIIVKLFLIIIYFILFLFTVSLLVGDSYNPFLYFRF